MVGFGGGNAQFRNLMDFRVSPILLNGPAITGLASMTVAIGNSCGSCNLLAWLVNIVRTTARRRVGDLTGRLLVILLTLGFVARQNLGNILLS